MRWPVGAAEEDAVAIDHPPGLWESFNGFNNHYRINGVGDLQWHTGIDFKLPDDAADHEAPIYAILPGVVTFSGIGGGTWGWIIDIRHTTAEGKTIYARYAHVDHTTFAVPKTGDFVREGQQIARLGNGDMQNFFLSAKMSAITQLTFVYVNVTIAAVASAYILFAEFIGEYHRLS